MTKNEFIAYCKQLGLTCAYSGNTRTMYVSPSNVAAHMLKYFVVKNFSIKSTN